MGSRRDFIVQLSVIALGFSRPAILFATPSAASASSPVSATTRKIPFVVGLSTVRAVNAPEGDYETLRIVTSIDASGYEVVTSAEVPDPDAPRGLRSVQVTRKVLVADQASATKMRSYFHEGDAASFPGTVPGFSAATVTDLRSKGQAALTYVDVGELFGTSVVKGEFRGTIARVAGASAALPVLVNGQSTELPVIHAKGTLMGQKGPGQFEFYVLDDPANPILLHWSSPGHSTNVLRIEYPEPRESPGSIESELSKNEVAKVYGIYFSFNRADIRPESERVLREIAGVMQAHPKWKLRVDGHTDGIGNDADNLNLSQRRSTAVKEALVSRYHINADRLTTGGYGESQPQDTNETPEGRARNRRVELRRE